LKANGVSHDFKKDVQMDVGVADIEGEWVCHF
jgi:hypothetical protein